MEVGPIVVVLNGEIYNYRELREQLRQEGEVFTGTSDTEVLARAYLRWGRECIDRLRGMWAFAIFDSRSRTLLCSRDPFGIKPFYYTWLKGAFLFASEPQALLRAGVASAANLEVVAQYLAFGIVDHGQGCFFDGIIQLGRGETVLIGADATLRPVSRLDVTMQGTVRCTDEDFSLTLQESVRLHLRSDVPVGTCLSGGLDSSTVAAVAASAVRQVGGPRFSAVTASSGVEANDERRYAGLVARECDLAWHVVQPDAGEFVAQIEECLRAQGEPALSPSVYFQYCVMRAARAAGLKVMLDGQGADELLCGYERYVPIWARQVVRECGALRAVRGFLQLGRNSRHGLRGISSLAAYMLSPRLRRYVIARRTAMLRAELRPAVDKVIDHVTEASRDLRAARIADLTTLSLPALLRYEDRNSMAHSIEARVPYVDRAVATCALSYPDTQLLHDGFTKYPLRKLAAQVLPPSIAWRPIKVGFEPPTHVWMGALRERMRSQIENSTLLRRVCQDVPGLDSLPLALQWRFYNVASWQRMFSVQ
jgi:asparagine synthase (glutamine-hydrolysing)